MMIVSTLLRTQLEFNTLLLIDNLTNSTVSRNDIPTSK